MEQNNSIYETIQSMITSSFSVHKRKIPGSQAKEYDSIEKDDNDGNVQISANHILQNFWNLKF